MRPNNFTPSEQALFLAQFSEDTFIVEYFLNKICDKFKFERFDDKAYWLDVRDEWRKLKTDE